MEDDCRDLLSQEERFCRVSVEQRLMRHNDVGEALTQQAEELGTAVLAMQRCMIHELTTLRVNLQTSPNSCILTVVDGNCGSLVYI